MYAVVTGSTKGIGLAVLRQLASEGWNVAASSRNHEDLQRVKLDIESLPGNPKCFIHTVDFSHKEETICYGQHLLEELPQIDLLINNAGVFYPGSVHQEDDGVLEDTMALNLFSPYHLTRTLLPSMMGRRKGHIINVCSIASFMAYPNGGAYTISKFALLGFSKALREEMKPYGIRVTSVMPGATWSASWGDAPYPDDRLMPPEDVAEIIVSTTRLSAASAVEEIIIRPQLGDL
jgi:short-subunit dehydrogenase